MSFKSVVVLGGGPIGLLCAIEARRCFKDKTRVFVVEKRSAYTRGNVPLVDDKFRAHLNTIGVGQKIWAEGTHASFATIEEKLFEKAEELGVTILTDYVVESLTGADQKKRHGRFKRIALVVRPTSGGSDLPAETLYQRDKAKKKKSGTVNLIDIDLLGGVETLDEPARRSKTIDADLLIVATGTGAASDPIVSKMGFTYERLHAANYATYGLFDKAVTAKANLALETDRKAVSTDVRIRAQDHNYLLVILNGLSRADFRLLQSSGADLKRLLTQIGRYASDYQKVVDGAKSAGVFKVKMQRAEHCASTTFPAVLVGDAAVAPHPQAGSGILSGFKGLLALQKLMTSLRSRDRSDNNEKYFDDFDEEYSAETVRKAVEGTWYMLTNVAKLVAQIDLRLTTLGSALKPAYKKTIKDLKDVDAQLKQHLKDLDDKCGLDTLRHQDLTIPAATAAGHLQKLWSDFADTYRQMKQLTNDVQYIDEVIDRMEKT